MDRDYRAGCTHIAIQKKEVHLVADAVGQDEVHGNRSFCMIHAFSAPIVVCIVQELDCGMRAFACRVQKKKSHVELVPSIVAHLPQVSSQRVS